MCACTHGGGAHRQQLSTSWLGKTTDLKITEKLSQIFRVLRTGFEPLVMESIGPGLYWWGATQKSCHICFQLVLTNMIMITTYTKIKLNSCPTPPPPHHAKGRSKYDVIIKKLWHHVAYHVISCAWKNGSTARTKSILYCHWIGTWGCIRPTMPT